MMEKLNKKFNLAIETLTPLCIGAGAEKDLVKGADYVERDGKVYKLNLHKMVTAGIDITKITPLIANRKNLEICNLIGNKLEMVSDKIFNKSVLTDNDIKSFIKNELSGKPIIPGSSLKGAIRSILFQYLGGCSIDGKEVFGNSINGDEFMRFIKVADAEFEETQLVNTKIFNLSGYKGELQGGWKHEFRNGTNKTFDPIGFNTVYESIMPNQIGYSSLMISDKAFNNINWKDFYYRLEIKSYDNYRVGIEKLKSKVEKKSKIINSGNSLEKLFGIINNHTRKYLEKEKAFFSKYDQAEHSQSIIDGIDDLIGQIPENNSYCILKMSAGSGFHSITGDWQFDDYSISEIRQYIGHNRGIGISRGQNKESAKSRKIAVYDNRFSLMGFVKLTAVSDEEMREMEIEKAEKLAKIEAEKQAAAKQRDEELRMAKERQERYTKLISEANELYDKLDYEQALSKFKEAAMILPERKDSAEKIDLLEKKLEQNRRAQENEERLKAEAEAAALHRQEQIEGGLSFLNDKFDDGRFKVTGFRGAKDRIESWLKKSKNTQLPSDQIVLLSETLKRIYSTITKEKEKKLWSDIHGGIWKDVAKWVDASELQDIYNKTIN